MPHISVTLYKGRDRETLEKVANTLRDSLSDMWGPDVLSVSVKEVEPAEFQQVISERLKDEELYLASNSVK
ncbi:MAG: tautomerase enzyme [Mogibacterium sp.]|nr:tautomerase enzyme [Mogibacterium sp.]